MASPKSVSDPYRVGYYGDGLTVGSFSLDTSTHPAIAVIERKMHSDLPMYGHNGPRNSSSPCHSDSDDSSTDADSPRP